eukprot:jgi/Mesvir1/17391/Mv08689-RA.1
MGPSPAVSRFDKQKRSTRLSKIHVYSSVKEYVVDNSSDHHGCDGTQKCSAARVTVVVDVLRATSSIISAIQAGAALIVPLPTPECCKETARELHSAGLDRSLVILSGAEHGGRKIQGFDLGNSPQCFKETVRGKVLLFHTTNGTKGLLAAAGHVRGDRAEEPDLACTTGPPQERPASCPMLIMSLLNVQAVARALLAHEAFAECAVVDILCCGTDAAFSVEDSLCAGALVDALKDALADVTLLSPPSGPEAWGDMSRDEFAAAPELVHPLQLNDLAWACWQLFLLHRGNLLAVLQSASLTGRRLTRVHGLHADVAVAAQLNTADDVVPVYIGGCIQRLPVRVDGDACDATSSVGALLERVRGLLPG